jgi:hypothetical protein
LSSLRANQWSGFFLVACCRFFGHEVKLIPPWFQNRSG